MKLLNHLNLEQNLGVETDDDACGMCKPNSLITFKTRILKSRDYCDYSHAYILMKGTIAITGARADVAGLKK